MKTPDGQPDVSGVFTFRTITPFQRPEQFAGLETLGPVLLSAAMGEDMFLVGSIVMILSSLTVIGTLISDILLAWIDPRIRFDKVSI